MIDRSAPAARRSTAGVFRRSPKNLPPRIDKRNADPRTALAAVVDASPDSYAALSRMLGRSEGYLRRFVVDGTPIALRPDEHRRLADYFGLDERALGVRDLWVGRR